jgi:hypothetical protein
MKVSLEAQFPELILVNIGRIDTPHHRFRSGNEADSALLAIIDALETSGALVFIYDSLFFDHPNRSGRTDILADPIADAQAQIHLSQ